MNNSPSRRDAAKAQFERAEKARQALEARPENARTLKDYTALVIEYQRVYLITSHAADVPASLNQVAELFRTMGDLFDAKYYQRSIDSFQFLLQSYPTKQVPRRCAAGHRAHRAGRLARFRSGAEDLRAVSGAASAFDRMPRKFARRWIS